MKRSRLLIILVVLLLAGMAFAGPAAAEEIQGVGTIHASGRGIAVIHGDGTVDVEVRGVGMVFVRGAETLQAAG